MHAFTDNQERPWTLEIHVGALKRVKALCGVELHKLVDDELKPLAALVADPVKLVDVLYVLCQEQAVEKGLTDEDFGRAMAGDTLEQATDAFVEELIDFFPDARVRAGLRKMLSTARQVKDKLLQRVAKETEKLDADAIASTLLSSAGNAQGSSASTRRRARSAS